MSKQEIIDRLTSKFASALEVVESKQPEPYIYILCEKYHELCEFVQKDSELDFDFLFQLAAVHYPDDCFEVVLSLSSHEKLHNMMVKVKLDINNPEVVTVSDIWHAANWYEREAMELFGIKFTNHPDPRPLLLVEDWNYGYPMRKGWTGPDFIPMPEK
jgi:NADH:ubiquinone oxidoreductase subunit C